MVNKKYLWLAGLCSVLCGGPALAQESPTTTTNISIGRDMTYRGENYDPLDSSYISPGRMDQHRSFLNHQSDYPAKPRNMWEVGGGIGLYNVSGDVPSLMPWEGGGFGLHAHVRKALGYVFSTRLAYNYGLAKGLSWQPAYNYFNNNPWREAGYAALTPGQTAQSLADPVYYNYRMESHQLNLDLVVTLNNIRFHKDRTRLLVNVFAGIGALAYGTRVNATNDNGGTGAPTTYQSLFDTIARRQQVNQPGTAGHPNHSEVQKMLEDGMDDSYESPAEGESRNRRPGAFGRKTLDFIGTYGLGLQYRLNPRVNLQLEGRVTFPQNGDDLIDGQRWAEQVPGNPVMTNLRDGIQYASLGVNFNLGSSARRVEPLYWLNPLDFIYNEMTAPRRMIVPTPVLGDQDGDGIFDQFDKCPGTPAGVNVDSHGCPMDTDGDGVPDDRDKQLITPTDCQPVDADGVGKCPCPEGCGGGGVACGNISAGTISFAGNTARLSGANQQQLTVLATQMQANPTCRVVISGAGNQSKVQQQRSWDRVNAVIEYMTETHKIDRNRFIFQYGQTGDANSVMYRSALTGEEGPANAPPPFPNLRRE